MVIRVEWDMKGLFLLVLGEARGYRGGRDQLNHMFQKLYRSATTKITSSEGFN